MNVVLTGSIAIDRIMVFPGKFADVIQPDKLHVLSISVLLDKLQDTPGGIAANIAYTLALLGDRPILYGSVGESARTYMSNLTQVGVDTSRVHYSALPTATFTVMTDQQDCQVGGFYPGAMGDAASLTLQPWAQDDEVLIVISPHDPGQMARQVKESVTFKKRLFYDVGQQAINIPAEDIKAGIEAAELLIVNDYEMGVLEQKTGWTQAEIVAQVKLCVVTLGEKGCVLLTTEKEENVSAVPVKQVADPTGAGDAFRGGFLYGYLRGWPAAHCARLGAVTAAYAVEQLGTQSHTFSPTAVAERYQAVYKENVSL
jgi:adenosine kinase